MVQSITVTPPADIKQAVEELSQEQGVSPDEVVSQAVKQHVFLKQFRSLRERLAAKAKEQGVITDQDVFDRIS
ncbi:MAG: ribbon-helix-helix domain-containing protein [Planctomycetota bacterium]|nr:ribbon-helix-helix domain-containing protein [Planctomycetota bacterium]